MSSLGSLNSLFIPWATNIRHSSLLSSFAAQLSSSLPVECCRLVAAMERRDATTSPMVQSSGNFCTAWIANSLSDIVDAPFGSRAELHEYFNCSRNQSNSVAPPVPLRSPFRGFVLPLPPSSASQFTSSIGGGITSLSDARFTTSEPLPPRQ